eukprot:2985694-Amphidinium_carterae.1
MSAYPRAASLVALLHAEGLDFDYTTAPKYALVHAREPPRSSSQTPAREKPARTTCASRTTRLLTAPITENLAS